MQLFFWKRNEHVCWSVVEVDEVGRGAKFGNDRVTKGLIFRVVFSLAAAFAFHLRFLIVSLIASTIGVAPS